MDVPVSQPANQYIGIDFESYFVHSLDAILVADDNGRYLAANDAACLLLGYSREALLQMRVADLIAVEGPAAGEQYRDYVAAGRQRGSFAFRRPDGQTRIAEYAAIRIAPERNVSVLRDITEELAARDRLTVSEERFRTMVQQAPFSIQVFSPDGYPILANKAWEQLWGVRIEDIPDYNILRDPQLVARGVMPLIERGFRGEAVSIPAIYYHPDETLPGRTRHSDAGRWTAASLYPVRDAHGTPYQFILVHVDVTEEQRAMAALAQSEARFRAIFDMAAIGLAETALDGRWLKVNRRLCEIVGYSEDELLTMTWQQVTHPDDVSEELALQGRVIAGELESYSVEKRYVRRDGQTRWTVRTVSLIRDTVGAPAYFVAASEDITDRKEAEVQIAALNERLQRAMTETHHRVKNNLQMIAAMADMELMSDEAMLSRESVSRLATQARVLATVHDMLTHQSRSGGNTEMVSASAILSSLVGQLRLTTDRRIDASIEDAWLTSRQATSLAIIANEAILNALKHAAGDVSIRFAIGRGVARLIIADRGPGLPPAFNPASTASTGVALIQHLGRWDLRGQVHFDNHDQGARVTVEFPVVVATESGRIRQA